MKVIMISNRNRDRKYLVTTVLAVLFFCTGISHGQIMPRINPATLAKFTASGVVSWLAAKKAFETGHDYLLLKDAANRYKREPDLRHIWRAASFNVHANMSGALALLSGLVAVKALLSAKDCVF